jgi:AcrR family transcriptional regulator
VAGERGPAASLDAQCNKQAIYAYFDSKEGLCDAVLNAIVADIVETVPIDAFDLPGYAISLFDRYQDHPETLRLITWYQLEGKTLPEVAVASTSHKIEAIRRAQEAGAISRRFSPEVILMLVINLTRLGAPDSVEASCGMVQADVFRRTIADAVVRLVGP